MTESKQAAAFRWLCEKRLRRNCGMADSHDLIVLQQSRPIKIRPGESIADAVIRAMEADDERGEA